MWGFLNPAWANRVRQNELKYFREEGVKQAVEWDAMTTKWKQYLVLNGKTYKPESLIPEAPVLKVTLAKEVLFAKGLRSPSGRWVYVHWLIPKGEPMSLYQPGEKKGHVRFTTQVTLPALLEVKPGRQEATIWMSLTPSEMMTQRNGIRKATGEVVVYGLGMGWLLAQVCAKKSVTKVTVVEKEKEIIDWFKPKILALYPQTAKVTKWVCGDAYEYAEKSPADDKRVHLFDIWPGYKDAPWDERFQKIKDRLPKVWGWGDHYVKELHG